MKEKLNIISKIIMMLLTLCVLVVSIYAWYVANDEASVSGVTGLTSNDDNISFKSVTAKIYKLDGTIITNTYTVDGNTLKLNGSTTLSYISATSYDSNTTYYKDSNGTILDNQSVVTDDNFSNYYVETTTSNTYTDPTYFAIKDILPGEYIEVSIEYTLSSIEAKDVNISLKNVVQTGGAFKVTNSEGTQCDHYALGAFKYKNISIVKNNNTNSLSEDYKVTNDTTFKRNTTYYTYDSISKEYTKADVTIGNYTYDVYYTYGTNYYKSTDNLFYNGDDETATEFASSTTYNSDEYCYINTSEGYKQISSDTKYYLGTDNYYTSTDTSITFYNGSDDTAFDFASSTTYSADEYCYINTSDGYKQITSTTYYEDSYEWLYEYDIDEDDDESVNTISLYTDSWGSDEVDGETSHTFTFSIYEDFKQYYQLISQSTGSNGRLSEKGINIDYIYFQVL